MLSANGNHRRPRIAYLTQNDPSDRRSWSGTQYYMAQALQKHCGDVTYLGPLKSPFLKFRKLMALASKKLTGKTYLQSHTFSVSKRVGRIAAQRIKQGHFDVIFAPAESVSLAHLQTNLPIIYLSDTTLALLSGYYPEFSNLRPRSLREANAVEQMAINKAQLLLYSSAWAARSAVKDYGADEKRIHVLPLGANIDEWPSADKAVCHQTSATCKLLFVGVDWERKGEIGRAHV
jgi:hypothetical protein